MEQRYWEQFMKTGGICDYLGYKMEEYGHGKDWENVQEGQKVCKNTGVSIITLGNANTIVCGKVRSGDFE